MSGASGASGPSVPSDNKFCCSNEKFKISFGINDDFSIFEKQPIGSFGPFEDKGCLLIKIPKNFPKVSLLTDKYYSEILAHSEKEKHDNNNIYYIIIGILVALIIILGLLTIYGFMKPCNPKKN